MLTRSAGAASRTRARVRAAGYSVVLIALAACALPADAEPVQRPEWDAAFQALATLELGQSLDVLQPIERAVAEAHGDAAVREAIERRLIAALDGSTTDLGKDYVCRQLALVGSDSAVPALARLLPNERMAYMARFGLEGIGSPAAAAALVEALAATSGRERVGVVISLGRLAAADAAAAVGSLLAQNDAELQQAAVAALGRIATPQAAESLRRFAPEAPAALKPAVVDAALQAAELLCRCGQQAEALKLCDSLEADPSERVRAAALRVRIAATPAETAARIVAGLGSDEAWRRDVAADCLLALSDPQQIQSVAEAVPGLPAPGKAAALWSLKARRHPAVRTAALHALDAEATDVRLAALEALVVSGAGDDAAALARLAGSSDAAVAEAARSTLQRMTAEGTDEAILALLSDPQALTPALVRSALGRRSMALKPGLLAAAASPEEAVRLAAFESLEILATEDDAPALVALLAKTPPGALRETAGRAVWMSCQKIAEPSRRAEPLLAAMKTADAAGQCALLPSLARLGGAEPLAAVHAAMQSDDQSVRDAGYRALANWPDASVAEELLTIAQAGPEPPYRIWALRAYARVVALPSDRPPQETFQMLSAAMQLAQRPDERQLIVSRLESVRVPKALELLVGYLDDPELRDAAVPAVFTLAKGLSQSHPAQAKAALEKVLPLTKDEAVRQQIPKVLRDIEARTESQQ